MQLDTFTQLNFNCAKSTQITTTQRPIPNFDDEEEFLELQQQELDDFENLQQQELEDFENQYGEELNLISNVEDEENVLTATKNQTTAEVQCRVTNNGTPKTPQKDIEPVNRRLFSSPQTSAATSALNNWNWKKKSYEEGPRNKRPLERDLFGDIDDLYLPDTHEDPKAKKARTEEERDLELIERILEARRNLRDANKKSHRNELEKLQELLEYKRKNLSLNVPNYPSLPLIRSNNQRIFVRYHNEEYENRAINDVAFMPDIKNMLGTKKEQVWEEARALVLKRLEKQNENKANINPLASKDLSTEKLWVEKYKPTRYLDLLSDETANRDLLTWLKMWDRVVFGV